MPFIAYDVALDAIRCLRVPLAKIAAKDSSLGSQIRRAAASVTLNLDEGSARRGADRTHLYRIAAGSAREVRAGLDTAVAFGTVDADEVADAWSRFDRVVGLLWPLTK